MRARRSLIPLVAALFAARCADHPTAVQQLAPAPHFLTWAGGAPPRFTATGAVSGRAGNRILLAAPSGTLSIDKTAASFWAVRGQQRSLQINYLSATGDTSSPFLRLTITDPTYAPAQGSLALGDSVLITVTVDPQNIKVSLEPTGLLFGDPAQFQISYAGAAGDLNGDGVVDSTDAYIETQLLGLWYRESADSTWARIPAVQDLLGKSFITALAHFCDYAYAW